MFRRWFGGVGRSLWDIAISIDQLGNVLIGLGSRVIGNTDSRYGEPDETISSVLGRKAVAGELNGLERALVYGLDWIDENHVFEAIEYQVEGSRPSRSKVLQAPRDNR